MIVNYLKTAIRNIRRHRAHSILNITGLAMGMACAIVILLWVRYELSFDRYHEHAERIYRLATEFHFGTFQGKYAVSNNAPGPTLERDFPEVEKAARFHAVWGISTVYQMGAVGQYFCLAVGLLVHDRLAGRLPVSHLHRFQSLCPGRSDGTGNRFAGRQLSNHQSGQGQSGGCIAL